MKHINLASGVSYFDSPDMAHEAAIQALANRTNQYGPVEGTEALRKAIASRYSSPLKEIEPDQVYVSSGTKHALYNALSVLLEQDDEVIIPTPAWFGFHELIKHSKGKLIQLPTTLSDGYIITPEALKEVLNERSRLLILTNPGNPTGRIYSKTELEALLEIAATYPDLYILSDEIYDFITYSSPFTSILSCEGPQERIVVVNGFSKTFAMTDWRVGYTIGSPEFIKKCIEFQFATFSGISQFAQAGALAVFENRTETLQPIQADLSHNRTLMQAGLEEIEQVRYYLPEGAYYFFPDLSYYLGTRTPDGDILNTTVALCTYFKEHYKLEMVPGDLFGSPGHVRISFALNKEELQEAMRRLQLGLEALRPVL